MSIVYYIIMIIWPIQRDIMIYYVVTTYSGNVGLKFVEKEGLISVESNPNFLKFKYPEL